MLIRYIAFALMAFAAFSFPSQAADEDGFQALFDGQTLDGWVQRGGKATYVAKDGMIVGMSTPDTPNSFLCTKKGYGDFTLKYEYLCDNRLNSGVQIRSEYYDQETTVKLKGKNIHIPAGRVFGYQVEIDPNKPERLWSAGIYDEGRRGWLYPGLAGGDSKDFTQQGKKIYRPDQWNQVRVECRGDHIRTWLNGQLRADFHDDATASGFIGLQVHGVGNRREPLAVRWRDLMIQE